jgi:hypothetical protein
MDYEKKYKDAVKWIDEIYSDLSIEKQLEAEVFFPEIVEIYEDEKIRKKLIHYVENWKTYNPNSPFDDYAVYTSDSGECNKILAWLEKQQPLDKEELAEETLKYVARQFMNWLDASTPEDKMCLSNMECEDIENAFLKDDWARIANYIKKKLEKQGKSSDKAEHKFKVGDKVVAKSYKTDVKTIEKVSQYGTYWTSSKDYHSGWWSEDELEPYVEHKTLNPAEVIAWLEKNATLFGAKWCHTENILEQFKKDFGL